MSPEVQSIIYVKKNVFLIYIIYLYIYKIITYLNNKYIIGDLKNNKMYLIVL